MRALILSLPIVLAMSGLVQASPMNAHEALIARHAAATGVPPELIRRVIWIESRGNPRAVSKGNYGLMQIRLGTARAMGYRGNAQGLLDADTNMTYAVRYLAGALRAARGSHDGAIRNYQRGYYYQAKAQGFSPYAVSASPRSASQARRQAPAVAASQPARVRTPVRSQGRASRAGGGVDPLRFLARMAGEID